MPLAVTGAACVSVNTTSRDICIRFPVGQEVCAQIPSIGNVDPSELVMALFQQANAALAPLSPFFNILDTIIAIVDVVAAIPKAIVTLSPGELIESLGGLVGAFEKMLNLIPQLSLPILIIDILDALIYFLTAQKTLIERMIAKQERIIAAQLKASQPGQFQLLAVVDCLNANFDVDIANVNEAFSSINRLIGLINRLLHLLGLPCIPSIGSLSGPLEPFLAFLQAIIDVLIAIRSVIPLPPSGSLGGGLSAEDC